MNLPLSLLSARLSTTCTPQYGFAITNYGRGPQKLFADIFPLQRNCSGLIISIDGHLVHYFIFQWRFPEGCTYMLYGAYTEL